MISFLIEENEGIRNFLEGSNDYIPTSEYMYLHDRPLLRPNFVTQIHDRLNQVGEKILAAKLTGKPIDRLTQLAIQMGQQMDGVITEEKAKTIVLALRDLYNYCNLLDKQLK